MNLWISHEFSLLFLVYFLKEFQLMTNILKNMILSKVMLSLGNHTFSIWFFYIIYYPFSLRCLRCYLTLLFLFIALFFLRGPCVTEIFLNYQSNRFPHPKRRAEADILRIHSSWLFFWLDFPTTSRSLWQS